jgi:hypothetical protein
VAGRGNREARRSKTLALVYTTSMTTTIALISLMVLISVLALLALKGRF